MLRAQLAAAGGGGPAEAAEGASATDPASFQEWGVDVLRWITDYRARCQELPVISTVAPNYLRDALPSAAPEEGEDWRNIMADLDSLIVPGLTHWESSSRFFAYFKPHSSYPAILGETLCAGLNVMGFDWIASPACTELEVVTLDWLGQILNLPQRFLSSSGGPGGGVIQGSAGESAVVVLLAAVERVREAQRRQESGGAVDGGPLRRDEMVVYGSDQTHTIVKKACMILGVRYHVLPTRGEENWALRPSVLEARVQEDQASGLTPVAAVATTGTTSSCAFDPVAALAAVCGRHGLWLHIDAAYGGAYACLPELAPLFKGVELADSFCVNCHKKLLCPFDLAALYLADRRPVLRALSVDSEYLRNEASASGAVVDYEHWQLPLGRRFRALKLWFVLRRFGSRGVVAHVRRGVELRQLLEPLIEAHPALELAAPPSLSLVCFRLRGRPEADQQELLRRLKATGECFVIHTRLGGEVVIRFACGGVEQSDDDVLSAWKVIDRLAREVAKCS